MKSLFFAFFYFTNLPVIREPGWDDENAAASLAWLPLTGLVIGLCLAALYAFCLSTGFPRNPVLLAIMIMGLELWIGGSRYIEGFSKTCDGIFAGLGGKRGLEMTSDSHIGRKGVIGLVFASLAKSFLLAELSASGGFIKLLIFYPCWTRWAYSFAACVFQVAGDAGMASFFKVSQKPSYIILSSAFTIMILMMTPAAFYAGALLSFLVIWFYCSLTQSRFGGFNEEAYGLIAVVAELSFLFFCAISVYSFGALIPFAG